jgi:hypothetical protein
MLQLICLRLHNKLILGILRWTSRPSVRSSYICELVLAITPLSDFHEIRHNNFYTKLSEQVRVLFSWKSAQWQSYRKSVMILYPKCRRRSFTVPAVQQLTFIEIGRAKALLYLQMSWNYAPTFHIFTPVWLKFYTGDLYLNTSRNCEFHESGRNNNTSLTGVMDFHIYCPFRVKSHIRELHVMFLSMWELRENRPREGRTFVTGVSENTFTRAVYC